MTTPKHDVVRLRLTTLEKQDWANAAGGSRKLSEWIRSVCNDAAQNAQLDSTVLQDNAMKAFAAKLPPGARVQVENLKPQVVEDAISREVAKLAPPAVPPPLPRPPASTQCDRWMHHRKGVYCGSCKRVTT